MTATASHKTRIIAGDLSVSCIGTQVTVTNEQTMLQRTSFCDEHKVSIKGQKMHNVTTAAMFDDDTSAGSYWQVLTDANINDTLLPVVIAPTGLAASAPVWLAEAYENTYGINSDTDGTVDLALEFAVTGAAGLGQSLSGPDPVTADGNGGAIDNTASTANGGIAHLHVTDIAGTASPALDVVIEHSTNGSSSWATLATFTQVTTTTASQRLIVAPGTAVRRYLRAAFTVAGTNPSYTLAVAFARS